MKKRMLLMALALLLALPALGLAAEVADVPEAEAAPEVETAPEDTFPYGMMRWHRRNTAPDQTEPSVPFGRGPGRWYQAPVAPLPFADENEDGICDVCGREPGKNPKASGFVDEDGDGICDHLGAEQQLQGRMGMRMPRGRGMRGHMRGPMGQQYPEAPNYAWGCRRR